MRALMQRALVVTLVLTAQAGWAALEKGEVVPNKCYTTVEGKQFCLDDAKDRVRVLIHNAGWCGPCNEEMDNLVPHIKDYDGMPVTFVSISGYGWISGSNPDAQFLQEWKDKHKIPFTVVGAFKDVGKIFFDPPLFIPNVVIIGKDGRVAYKEVAPEVDVMLQEVNAALKLR